MPRDSFPSAGAERRLTIAVLSDLHAFDQKSKSEAAEPSYLCTLAPRDLPGQHPIRGLQQLIENEKLRADILLCPGDLGDKARPAGIQYGWRAVHEVAGYLNAGVVVGNVGNHDVDSRYK